MKKSLFVLLAVSAILMSSCSKSTLEDDFVNMDVLTVSETITVDASTKSGITQPVQINLSASYSIAEDKIISANFTPLSSDIDADALNLAIHDALVEKLGPDFYDFEKIESYITSSGQEDAQVGACVNACKEKYAKKQGRGKCKFDCWVDFTKSTIEWLIEETAKFLTLGLFD